MASELSKTRKTSHTVVAGIMLAVVVVAALLAWRAVSGAGQQVLHGTVSIVNAQGTKFCVTQPGQDQWCGLLATPGGTSVSTGQQVTVLVSSVDAASEGEIEIGTLIPKDFAVK